MYETTFLKLKKDSQILEPIFKIVKIPWYERHCSRTCYAMLGDMGITPLKIKFLISQVDANILCQILYM